MFLRSVNVIQIWIPDSAIDSSYYSGTIATRRTKQANNKKHKLSGYNQALPDGPETNINCEKIKRNGRGGEAA